jgi:hypothetical protein
MQIALIILVAGVELFALVSFLWGEDAHGIEQIPPRND